MQCGVVAQQVGRSYHHNPPASRGSLAAPLGRSGFGLVFCVVAEDGQQVQVKAQYV